MVDVNKGVGSHLEPMWDGAPDSYGAGSIRHGQYTFATSSSGTVAYVAKIPAGALIVRAYYKSADLGGSTATISIGIDENGVVTANKFGSGLDISGAAVAMTLLDFAPFKTTMDTDIIITTAVANVTGQVDVLVDYVFLGTAHIAKLAY